MEFTFYLWNSQVWPQLVAIGTFVCIERSYLQVEEKTLLHSVAVQFFLVQSRQSLEQSSKWCGVSSVGECFQGKIGQALEGILFYAGSWRFYSSLTSDQPTGLSGLMSRAEDKGKGKGNTYVSVGKGSFEWRKYTWESAVFSKLFAMAIGKMRSADVRICRFSNGFGWKLWTYIKIRVCLVLGLGSMLDRLWLVFVIFMSKKSADPHVRTHAFYPWLFALWHDVHCIIMG